MIAVALIGYGEVGTLFARDLHAAGIDSIRAYDIRFEPGVTCAPPAAAAASAAEAVAGADLVISAVTAGSAVAAAKSVAAALRPGALFLDVNSVSPGTKRIAADVIATGGGRYVEAAVMASVPPYGIRVPMLIGGPNAPSALAMLAPLGFGVRVHSPDIGVASAVKMCRSVVIKGLEALLSESLAAARHYGVDEEVLASLAETFPGEKWHAVSAYMIGRAMHHGRRRSEEMREVALTLSEAGLSPALGLAVADRQEWAYAVGRSVAAADLTSILDVLAAALPETFP